MYSKQNYDNGTSVEENLRRANRRLQSAYDTQIIALQETNAILNVDLVAAKEEIEGLKEDIASLDSELDSALEQISELE